MYVLVPDDPVFFAKFQSLEEPLLRHLYRLHRTGTDSGDERILSDAYDSWVQVLLKLPMWSEWHTTSTYVEPAPGEWSGYVLHGSDGNQLTSLYPVEVTGVELGHLTACLDLFADRDRDRDRERARDRDRDRAGGRSSARDTDLTEVFRRVMEVLLLPPPETLLTLLRRTVLDEAAASVGLPADGEAEYRDFCENIVTILSSGDTFAYLSHRAMYF